MNINKTKMITIRFQEMDYELIKKMSAKLFIRPSELLRTWIKNILQEELKKIKEDK